MKFFRKQILQPCVSTPVCSVSLVNDSACSGGQFDLHGICIQALFSHPRTRDKFLAVPAQPPQCRNLEKTAMTSVL